MSHRTTPRPQEEVPELLMQRGLFRGVEAAELEPHLQDATEVDLARGEVLLQPDVLDGSVYIVIEGELSVHIPSPDAEPLARLGAGECAGEMSILDRPHPSAWVVASRDCRLVAISKGSLWQILRSSHQTALNLLAILAFRAQNGNQELRRTSEAADTDPLTELPNRRAMERTFRRQFHRSLREGSPLSLAMIDVDHLEDLNDAWGHPFGDEVLRRVARGLRERLRPTDLCARYGGEEFAVLFPDTSQPEAEAIAERLREAIESLSFPEDPIGRISVSIGVAGRCDHRVLESLIGEADGALFRAKAQGRNRVERGRDARPVPVP